MDGIVPGILGGLLAAAILGWVLRRKTDVVSRDLLTSDLVLRYDRRYRALSVLLGLGVLLVWSVLLARRQFATSLDAYLGTILIVLGIVWLMLEVLRTHIRITPEGLVKRGAWGRTRALSWSAIRQVKYSVLNQWFVFIGADRTRLRVSILMGGIGDLERAVRAHLQPPTFEDAEAGFRLNRDR